MQYWNENQTVVVWTEPKITAIQRSVPYFSNLDALAVRAGNGEHEWEPDATELELAPIFAGRACYQSFGARAGRKTAEDYLGHIKELGHYSVLEHSAVSFYIEGVSRTFTHELIRHRMASYSQLSQRFVPYDEVMPLVVHPNVTESFEINDLLEEYFSYGEMLLNDYKFYIQRYSEKWGYKTFAEKKKVRETAREFLPNMTETKIVVTMNLRGWLEMLSKRNAPGADGQIRTVANQIQKELEIFAPHIFK